MIFADAYGRLVTSGGRLIAPQNYGKSLAERIFVVHELEFGVLIHEACKNRLYKPTLFPFNEEGWEHQPLICTYEFAVANEEKRIIEFVRASIEEAEVKFKGKIYKQVYNTERRS